MNILLPLVIGGIWYYIFEPHTSFVVWIDSLLSTQFVRPIVSENHFYILARNHILDMLWSYSLMFSVYYLMSSVKKRLVLSICITIISCLFLELIQLIPNVKMTFDWWDLIAEVFAVCIACILIRIKGVGYE